MEILAHVTGVVPRLHGRPTTPAPSPKHTHTHAHAHTPFCPSAPSLQKQHAPFAFALARLTTASNVQTPPLYHLGNITTPTALFFGADDYLGDPKDVQRIIDEMRPGVIVSAQEQSNFAHLDYTWGVDAHTYVYSGVVSLMAKYNPLPGAAPAPASGPVAAE
jgi:hypothetical protein